MFELSVLGSAVFGIFLTDHVYSRYMCTISKAWMFYLQVYWQSCIYIGSHDKCKLNCDTTGFFFFK